MAAERFFGKRIRRFEDPGSWRARAPSSKTCGCRGCSTRRSSGARTPTPRSATSRSRRRGWPASSAVFTAADFDLKPTPDGDPPPGLPAVQPAAARRWARSASSASRSRWWWPRSRYQAEDGAAALAAELDLDPLDVVPNAEAALAADAPLLHDDLGENVAGAFEVAVGDVEAAFARAAHVVKGRFTVQRYTGMPIETRGVMATMEPITGRYLVWSSTQWPHTVRTALAESLGVPEHRIRVDRAGPGRRLRRQAGHLPRGDGDPAGGRAAGAAGPLDRDPAGALRLHGPLARAGPRGRAGAGRGRRGDRAAGAGHGRPGRLHARAGRALPLDHGRVAARAVPDQGLPGDRALRPDQQGAGRGVSRGRRPGGGLRAGAHDGQGGARAWPGPGRDPPPQLHPAGRVPLADRARLGAGADHLRQRPVRGRAGPRAGAGGVRRLAREAGRRARRGAVPRDRGRELRAAGRARAVRERRGPGGPERRGGRRRPGRTPTARAPTRRWPRSSPTSFRRRRSASRSSTATPIRSRSGWGRTPAATP